MCCIAIVVGEWLLTPQYTEVSTVICDWKQLKKLIDLSAHLPTVKRIVYMEDKGIASEATASDISSNWTVASFSKVESLGREHRVDPNFPVAADIAVIISQYDQKLVKEMFAMSQIIKEALGQRQQYWLTSNRAHRQVHQDNWMLVFCEYP
eukprot:Gb_06169 [translate_table: standard]